MDRAPTLLATARLDPDLVVDEARTARDVARILREVDGRAWARRHGIRTADVVASDPDGGWLVSRRLVDVPIESEGFVEAALETALRIQGAPDPGFSDPADGWRASRRGLPWRVARIIGAGIDPRHFAAERAAFSALPHDGAVHNDFHRGNVFNLSTDGGPVAVIDWDLMTTGPRHLDMVQLIVDLDEHDLALHAWELLLSVAAPEARAALATQLRWIAVRTYASALLEPRAEVDRSRLARRRRRWILARSWADDVGGAA
ncbi:phosphotransferase [Nocardioides montaniterrae]